ncbi:MAG: hypothetical protein Kow0083_07610 [Methylophaga sp.]
MKIPSDWNMAKFGELAKITCGVAATPEYVDAAIGIPFLSARNVQKERLDLSYFQHIPRELHEKLTKNTKPAKGDVLLTRVGAGIGEAAVVDIDFEFSIYVSLTLIKCGKNLDSEYVKSLLNTNYYRYLATRDQFAGGGVQNLNVQMVKEYPIPVPPLPEQKKIAKILSTWDKAITTTEQLLANSQQQKKALMQQLLTGKKRLRDKNGVRFSGEWKHGHLSDLGEISKGKALSNKDLIDGDYPVIAGGKSSPYNHRDFTHENVITVSASGAYAGYVAYHPYKLWASDCSVVMGKANTDIRFIYQLMSHMQSKIYSLQSGGAQPHVYPKDLEVLRVSIPSIEEQQKIATVLSAADNEIEILKKQLDQLKQEKKSLMQQLLTGKRRVLV